jgi:hypothetical protein
LVVDGLKNFYMPFPPLPSPSDLILFNDLNEQLSTRLTSTQGGASELFAEKSFSPFTGMTNQGATCYLNSLIQSLYFLSPFREAVFKWRHNPELHGSQSDSIPLQLQVSVPFAFNSYRFVLTTLPSLHSAYLAV